MKTYAEIVQEMKDDFPAIDETSKAITAELLSNMPTNTRKNIEKKFNRMTELWTALVDEFVKNESVVVGLAISDHIKDELDNMSRIWNAAITAALQHAGPEFRAELRSKVGPSLEAISGKLSREEEE